MRGVRLAAGGEHMVTDLVDGVVQMLESLGDPLPRHAVLARPVSFGPTGTA